MPDDKIHCQNCGEVVEEPIRGVFNEADGRKLSTLNSVESPPAILPSDEEESGC
jgi:hypothetical protein